MTVLELYGFLNDRIPPHLSCEWDNDGLMCCPDPDKQVKKALITLDITQNAADYAAENGFDAIISHHPLIFRPLKNITSKKIIGLIKNGICAMSFHTRLDIVGGGVNDCIAESLGLNGVTSFGEDGIGRTGTLPHELSVEEFAVLLRERLGCKTVTAVTGSGKCRVIALVGGDGKDYLADALKTGADTYLTGSMSYNSMTDGGETPLNIIEAGHYYTEQTVCKRLAELVKAADGSIYTGIYKSNIIKEL